MKCSSKKRHRKDPETKFRVFFISLGCDKNLVDSEQMIGLLQSRGYEITGDEDAADLIVINSCCFIGDAREESINTIIEMGEKKTDGSLKALIVCGCLAQRYADEIKKTMPEVDAVIGTTAIDAIADAADKLLEAYRDGKAEGGSPVLSYINSIDRYVYLKGLREITGSVCSASLKIADGCNKNCSYCVIPRVRGHYRSVPMEDLISDATALAARGVKELLLIAQETTVYGIDIYGRKALPELLYRLCEIEGIEWIRLMYCYPEEITDELIECMKSEPKICHYLDLPIQHCSDRLLKLMGRKTTKDGLVYIIQKLRKSIPDIALRTTLISGFPGETEEEHEELKSFVRDMRFDRLGCFAYSREEGTEAAAMRGQIHHATKRRRQREIMELQQSIAFDTEAALKGRRLRVMVEGRIAGDTGDDMLSDIVKTDGEVYACRSYRDAPDIDGYVFVKSRNKSIMSGDMLDVTVTGSNGYDLTAE
ncbi:MAG: 30S ribosomal protein S12 methylthiotransferase RimO [Lachnospiraceae bacterium]|nr:30S ribosomal protein S12 methylthiotransferase RimO [Lachnospiraceae bacterium]